MIERALLLVLYLVDGLASSAPATFHRGDWRPPRRGPGRRRRRIRRTASVVIATAALGYLFARYGIAAWIGGRVAGLIGNATPALATTLGWVVWILLVAGCLWVLSRLARRLG